MKKTLLVLCLIATSLGVYALQTKEDYKQELNDLGFMYGCAPANWSLSEPYRGGFSIAAMKGRVDVMELEVKAGLDITSCGKNLPVVLIQKKQPEALDFLLKNGYSANGTLQGYSYLLLAEHYKDVDMVKTIIDNGADVNLVTKGYVPLNYAIKKGNAEIVEMLIKAGAKPDEKTKKLVAKTKNEQIKELLKDL